MNKRQSEILKILYKDGGYLTFSQIAEKVNVSVKTVRNDVAAIKEALEGRGSIETKPHVGIKFVTDESGWKSLNSEKAEEDKEIIFFIIRHLLKHGNLTAQGLAERYYIGRTQLEKILAVVSEWFFQKHICFERCRGKGISISGSEFNYRLACMDFYNEYIPFYAELSNAGCAQYAFMPENEYKAMCAALGGFNPDKIAKAVIDTEHEFGLLFNYASGVNLIFLISLCMLRVRKGHEIVMPGTVKCQADGNSGVCFAERLVQKLEAEYKIKIPDAEQEFIAFAADISEIRQFDTEGDRRKFEAMNIELCRFTVRAVNLVSEIAGIDLREDKFFVQQMFIQLKVTISRLKFGIVYKNRLLSQIKTKYPNMMAVAWFLENLFEKELGLEINEHEVGFLALHIGGAIERQLAVLTACIVCDYGIGVSQILKEKITRAIPDLRITSVFSGRDVKSIKNENCDFVISATSLEGYRINREIVTVGHLLDDGDINKIEDYMRKIRSKKFVGVKGISPNAAIFNEELVFAKCHCKDKKELLNMMCRRLESLGYVTKEFEESVMQREESAPTDIGKGFAIPHGLDTYVNHSVVAVATLEEAMEWTKSGDAVDTVFLIAFDPDENEQMKKKIITFYKSIVSFMEDEEECDRLRKLRQSKEIVKIFEKW